VFRNHRLQMKMKKLKKDQRGFTLLELLIAMLLTGIITGSITMTILQVFNMNTRTSNHMTAVRQVQHAGFWVSPDVQMAQGVDTENDLGTPEFELLTLTWEEGGTAVPHEVIYTLEDMSSGEFKILWRKHYIDIGSGPELDSTTKVAEYINPDQTQTSCTCCDQTSCHQGICDDDEWLTFKVTATVGEQSETRVYEVKPRPGSQ